MTFPQSLTTADGYLKTDIWIEQLFAVPEMGVYKIETVRSNGIAYFNLPVSRNIFWSVKEIFSDLLLGNSLLPFIRVHIPESFDLQSSISLPWSVICTLMD